MKFTVLNNNFTNCLLIFALFGLATISQTSSAAVVATPFYTALRANDNSLALKLIEEGAKADEMTIQTEGAPNASVFQFSNIGQAATSTSGVELVNAFLQRGDSPDVPDLQKGLQENIQYSQFIRPLRKVFLNLQREIYRHLHIEQSVKMVHLLLQYGANMYEISSPDYGSTDKELSTALGESLLTKTRDGQNPEVEQIQLELIQRWDFSKDTLNTKDDYIKYALLNKASQAVIDSLVAK